MRNSFRLLLGMFISLSLVGIADAATIFIDCPSIQVALPATSGSATSQPCILVPPPGGTITNLSLMYKYSITTGLFGGGATFDRSMVNPALSFFASGAPTAVTEPPMPTTGVLMVQHTPAPGELAALASNGAISLLWMNLTGEVLTLSADFRWTITFEPLTTAPEPTTLLLVGAGLIVTGVTMRRRLAGAKQR
jgi:hypothetical protein